MKEAIRVEFDFAHHIRLKATSHLGKMLVAMAEKMLLDWHLDVSGFWTPLNSREKHREYLPEFLDVLVTSGFVSLDEVEKLTLRETITFKLSPSGVKHNELRRIFERKKEEIQNLVHESAEQALEMLPDNLEQAFDALKVVQKKLKLTTPEWQKVLDCYRNRARELDKWGWFHLIARMMVVAARSDYDLEKYFKEENWTGRPSKWDLLTWQIAARKVSGLVKKGAIEDYRIDDISKGLLHCLHNFEYYEEPDKESDRIFSEIKAARIELFNSYGAKEGEGLDFWKGVVAEAKYDKDEELAILATEKYRQALKKEEMALDQIMEG